MEKFYAKFTNSTKYNIFLGEYNNKIINIELPSDVAQRLYAKIESQLNKNINMYSLQEVGQEALNVGFYNKYEIIDECKKIFEDNIANANTRFYSNLINSDLFKNIFSLSYDKILETAYPDAITCYSPFDFKRIETANINLFKIFGELVYYKSVITSQDVKKITNIDLYANFWEEIRKEFKLYPTIIMGLDNKNKTGLNILRFILKPILFEYKPIYYISNSNFIDAEMLQMFKDLNIKIVNIDEYEFLELLEKSSKLEQEEAKSPFEFQDIQIENSKEAEPIEKVETLPEEEKEEVTKIETQELTKTQELASKEEEKQNNIIDIAYLNATANNNNNEAETKPSENFNMAKLPLYEETQEIKEEKKITEPKLVEAKEHIINLSEKDKLETATEIRYASLFLQKLPIKYKNFSDRELLKEEIHLGNTDVTIGDRLLADTRIKILSYEKFTLLEIKRSDFSIAFEVRPNGRMILQSGGWYKYEISSNIKDNRLKNIVETLKSIFVGTVIRFTIKNYVVDVNFVNNIEVSKFHLLLETIEQYEKINKNLRVHNPKHFSELTNNFYDIYLLDNLMENQDLTTWINLSLVNEYNINVGDTLVLLRKTFINLKGTNFKILERIKIKDAVSENNIKDDKIIMNRRTADITLEKIL